MTFPKKPRRTAHQLIWLMGEIAKATGDIVVCVGVGDVDRVHELVADLVDQGVATKFSNCRVMCKGGYNSGFSFDQILVDETFELLDEDVYAWFEAEVLPRAKWGVRPRGYYT